MFQYAITQQELDKSLQFFRDSTLEVLAEVAYVINIQQPVFTQVIFSFEHAGLDVGIMEDLMESILVVYYVHSHIRKRVIPELTLEDIMGNLGGYAKSLQQFKESGHGAQDDVTGHAYLEDVVVLNYARRLLVQSFPNLCDIPKEVSYGYFALLKSIELAAAKVK